MFNLAVHPSVLDAVEALPAMTRARVVRSFSVMMAEGLLGLNYKKLSWISENDFKLSISRKIFDMDLSQGVEAVGFLSSGTKGSVFIRSLKIVDDKRRISDAAGIGRVSPDDNKDIDNYVEINKSWITEQLQDPFILKNQSEGLGSIVGIPATQPMLIRSRFYSDLDQIYISKKVEQVHGFEPYFINEVADRYCERIRFDATFKNKAPNKSLGEFLDSFRNRPDTVVIVNFIDELDPLSLAQSEFINSVIFFMRVQYPDLKIQVVDVIIRDMQGAQPYFEEFLGFHAQHRLSLRDRKRVLAPFTMVLGEIRSAFKTGQYRLPLEGYRRWFDIDLFADCRGKEGSHFLVKHIYQYNLMLSAYNLMRAGGVVNTGATKVQFRDLRGWNKEEADEGIKEVLKTSAVLLINDEMSSEIGKVAMAVSETAQCIGFPFIVTLQTDLVDSASIVVPQNMMGARVNTYKNIKYNDGTCAAVLNGVIDAYNENIYLAGLDCKAFLFEG